MTRPQDCSLYRHKFSEAAHPVLWANPQAVCVSSRGQLASALPDAPLPRPRTCAPERLVPGLGSVSRQPPIHSPPKRLFIMLIRVPQS